MAKHSGPPRRAKVSVRLPSGQLATAFRTIGSNKATTGPNPVGAGQLGDAMQQLADDTGAPTLAGRPVPINTFDEVFHIGTLNPDDLNRNYHESYEGAGLSVSVHPDDWRAIAKLGGYPTWTATKSSNAFVDRWALTAEQEAAVNDWAVAYDLLRPVTRFEVTAWDSESDSEYRFHCDTFEEALVEANDDPEAIREVEALAVTDRLTELTGTRAGDTAAAFDLALTVWARTQTSVDGVWWDDDYNPAQYSCPRGVIFPERFDGWEFTTNAS